MARSAPRCSARASAGASTAAQHAPRLLCSCTRATNLLVGAGRAGGCPLKGGGQGPPGVGGRLGLGGACGEQQRSACRALLPIPQSLSAWLASPTPPHPLILLHSAPDKPLILHYGRMWELTLAHGPAWRYQKAGGWGSWSLRRFTRGDQGAWCKLGADEGCSSAHPPEVHVAYPCILGLLCPCYPSCSTGSPPLRPRRWGMHPAFAPPRQPRCMPAKLFLLAAWQPPAGSGHALRGWRLPVVRPTSG